MQEITEILIRIRNQEPGAKPELLAAVYDQLRQMAEARMARERPDHTLNATDLVHEAWIRFGRQDNFQSRRHFFKAASEAMRRILIDHARAKQTDKRGGALLNAGVDPELLASAGADQRLHELNDALVRFETVEPAKAELVKLRYFVGLKIHEAAEVLGISTATADRYWAYAKAWLQAEMNSEE